MAALPYMQFHIADYLADTSHLSTEEHGAYLLLIFNYWQRAKALDNSNGRLANVARLSPKRWAVVRPAIEGYFEISGDTWTHPRIERDLAAVNAKCEGARNARAQRKNYGRTTNVPTNVEPTLNDGSTSKSIKREEEKRVIQGLDPEMVTAAVLDELRISGRDLSIALTDICRAELNAGEEWEALKNSLVASWREYVDAKPKLEFQWGATKFFGEGAWKNKTGWPWKDGATPAPKRRYM